ncbi:hypothetical protein J6590_015717, partial [Homalodisca vitripennis]
PRVSAKESRSGFPESGAAGSQTWLFNTVKKIEETRPIKDHNGRGRIKLAIKEQKGLDLLLTFVDNPSTSARKVLKI